MGQGETTGVTASESAEPASDTEQIVADLQTLKRLTDSGTFVTSAQLQELIDKYSPPVEEEEAEDEGSEDAEGDDEEGTEPTSPSDGGGTG